MSIDTAFSPTVIYRSLVVGMLAVIGWFIRDELTTTRGVMDQIASQVQTHITADVESRYGGIQLMNTLDQRLTKVEQSREDITSQFQVARGERDAQMRELTQALNAVQRELSQIEGRLKLNDRTDGGP